jgi:hypothetical protein
MKSKCAIWLTAILFAAAAGMLAQDNQDKSSPPPAPQASPVPESPVPPAPAEPGNPPPAENPALPQTSPALPQTAPSVTTTAPGSTAGAAPVDTIEKKASRRAEASSRKSAKKSVEPAPAPQAESKDKDKEKAAAGAAAIETNGSGNGNAPGSSPPSGTVDSGAAPPPAPVVENSAIEETRSSKTDVRERGMGVGSWVLIAIVFLGVIGAVALAIGNDTRDERISIVEPDLGGSPRSPLSHTRLS